MPQETPRNQKKIQCWVSLDTWDKLVSLGYDSPTIAVSKAFEKLIESHQEDPKDIPGRSQEDPIESHEIPAYKARIEELKAHNETLIRELEKAERDKEDLKNTYNKMQDTHNNYMAQMQTLIKQKVIEAPGAKKPWWQFW